MTISVAQKSAEAFRTISEVADALDLPQHVLRFWETRFSQIRPLKRAGGRRFYRPEDVELLGAIRQLLYGEGYTIKGVQRILREQGPRAVALLARQHGQPAAFAPLGEADRSQSGALMAEADDEAEADQAAVTPDEPSWLAEPVRATPHERVRPAPGRAMPSLEEPRRESHDPIERLRGVLDEIAACRDVLDAARG